MEHNIQSDQVDSRPTVFATLFGIVAFAAGYSVTKSLSSLIGSALLAGVSAMQFPDAGLRQPLILFTEVLSGGVAIWITARATRRLFSSANQRVVVISVAVIVVMLLFLNLLVGIEALRPSHGFYGVLAVVIGTSIATWLVGRSA